MRVEVVGGGDLDHAAEIHDRHAVADVLDDRQVVSDEEIGQSEFLLQVLEQIDDLGLDRDVERGYGLVADDQLRLDRERARYADALALAARELVRVAAHVIGLQADRLEQLDHPRRQFGAGLGEFVDDERLADDAADRHARVQRCERVLEDYLHVATERAKRVSAEVRDVAALEPDLAGRRLDEAQDAAAGRRLAAAGLADEPKRLSSRDVEADAIDGMHAVDLAREDAASH